MGVFIAEFTRRSRSPGQARGAMDRSAEKIGWHFMDSADGSAVKRPAPTVWSPHDSQPPIPRLAQSWSHRVGAPSHSQRCPKTWWIRIGGLLYGRHVCSAQRGGGGVGKTKRGKGTKIIAMADAHGLPIGCRTESAQHAEVKLAVPTTISCLIRLRFKTKLIADKVHDSDPLRDELSQLDIDLVVPHRRGRKRSKRQDGGILRGYKKRWKVERLFAWLNNFRRTVVRWEYQLENFEAFIQLAFAVILLRYL